MYGRGGGQFHYFSYAEREPGRGRYASVHFSVTLRLCQRRAVLSSHVALQELVSDMAPGKRKATSVPGSRPPVAPGPSRFLPCPACGESFLARALQQHAWDCSADRTRQQRQQGRAGGERREAPGTLVLCPMCSKMFPQHAIESHAWECRPPPSDNGPLSTVPSRTGPASETEAASTLLDNSGKFQARHYTAEQHPKATAAETYMIPAEGGNSNCGEGGAPKHVPQESEGKNAMQARPARCRNAGNLFFSVCR